MGDKYNPECLLPWDCGAPGSLPAKWKSLGHVLGEKKKVETFSSRQWGPSVGFQMGK